MIKIGLTGNIAAGKTEIRKIFEKLNIKTLCADSIVHEILEKDETAKKKIIDTFKNHDIISNNLLDRTKLGKLIFSDDTKKTQLEKIIHPLVIQKINLFIDEHQSEKIILIDIPLLFEENFENLFDKILLVYASDKTRFDRIKTRNNNYDDEHIKKIMNSQISQEKKKEKSDFIIINENKTLKEIEKEIQKLIEKIK